MHKSGPYMTIFFCLYANEYEGKLEEGQGKRKARLTFCPTKCGKSSTVHEK